MSVLPYRQHWRLLSRALLLPVLGATAVTSFMPSIASGAPGPYGLSIDPADAVLVSTTGSDATGTGTQRNPFRSIGKGVQVAAVTLQHVYVAAGEYVESVNAVSDVEIIGGFDAATWKLSGERRRSRHRSAPDRRCSPMATRTSCW